MNRMLSQTNRFIQFHHHKELLIICRNFTHLTSKSSAINCKYVNNRNVLLLPGEFHRTMFWERDKKGGYNRNLKKIPSKRMVLDGLKELKGEIKLWTQEVKEKLDSDPMLLYRPGEVDVAFEFLDKKDLDNWVLTSDSDHGEGKSHGKLEISPAGHGLFSGVVDSTVPLDGQLKRTGYCNIKTLRARKSFKRDMYLDWGQYNTLVLRVRGDGRSYLLNIACEGYYDIWWNDVYHYALYTRGGPHWQIARIPFSKFFLSSKGRIQDKQTPIPLQRVTSMGISVAARGNCNGAFNLEIDYIGLEFDPLNMEKFAYEMYKTDKFVVGV